MVEELEVLKRPLGGEILAAVFQRDNGTRFCHVDENLDPEVSRHMLDLCEGKRLPVFVMRGKGNTLLVGYMGDNGEPVIEKHEGATAD